VKVFSCFAHKILQQYSIFLLALMCAFLFYSGLVKVTNRNLYNSLLAVNKINGVEAVICSSVSKISSSLYYRTEISLRSVYAKMGEYNVKADASGHITALIPSKMVESYFPGKIFYAHSYFDEGVDVLLTGYVSDYNKEKVFIAESAKSLGYSGILKNLAAFRSFVRNNLRRALYSWKEAGGLLLALIMGSKEYVSFQNICFFQKAGISHILTISGMHLVSICGLVVNALTLIFGKKTYLFCLLITEIVFLYFVGLSPSLFRAFLCSFITILGASCYVRIENRINLLSIVFLIHVLLFPNQINSFSFLLTYSACAGIYLFHEKITKFVIAAFPPVIAESVAFSASAQIFSMPVAALLFGRIVPFSLFASIVISPIVTIFVVVGCISLVLSFLFPFLAQFFAVVMDSLYRIIIFLTIFFSRFPVIEIGAI